MASKVDIHLELPASGTGWFSSCDIGDLLIHRPEWYYHSDNILNRITQNRARDKNTFIFIDEIYLLFQHEYSANFLFTLWKRVRKYGAFCTGITQNVDDLLQSHRPHHACKQ